jgi:hypothetical protein
MKTKGPWIEDPGTLRVNPHVETRHVGHPPSS